MDRNIKYFARAVNNEKVLVKNFISDSKHGPVGAAIDISVSAIRVI